MIGRDMNHPLITMDRRLLEVEIRGRTQPGTSELGLWFGMINSSMFEDGQIQMYL